MYSGTDSWTMVLQKIRAVLRDFLGYTTSEVNGILVLLMLMTGSLLLLVVARMYPPWEYSSPLDHAQLDALLQQMEKAQKKEEGPPSFAINQATAEQLRCVRGIGPVLSKRIINYRNKLGGFVHSNQYTEVYGLEKEVVERLMQCTYIQNRYSPRKLSVHKATLRELASHPYITYRQAKEIVRYRSKRKQFTSTDILQHVFTRKELRRIAPYVQETILLQK